MIKETKHSHLYQQWQLLWEILRYRKDSGRLILVQVDEWPEKTKGEQPNYKITTKVKRGETNDMVIHANTHVYHANTRHADRTWINTTCRLSTRIHDTQVYHLKTRHVGLTREEDTDYENTRSGGFRKTRKGWFKKTRYAGLLLKDATRRRPSRGHDAQRLGQFWEIFENTCKINPLLPEGNCDYLFIP